MSTTTSPLVSILIPVYNRESIVSRAIDSALSQTYKNIEVIITDNCSSDNTWQTLQDYAAKDSRVKIFRNPTNIGPVRNWKRCLEESNGEYVKFIWSDDTIAKTFVEESIKVLEKDTRIGFSFTRTDIILKDKTIHGAYQIGESGKYKSMDFIKKSALNPGEVPVSPGCALFRRKDVVQGLKTNLPNPHNLDFNKFGAGVDLLLFLFTCQKYEYFYFIDRTLSFFYGGHDSFSIANDLSEYYTFSIVYFLKGHYYLREIKYQLYSRIWNNEKFSYMVPSSYIQYKRTKRSIKHLFDKLQKASKNKGFN